MCCHFIDINQLLTTFCKVINLYVYIISFLFRYKKLLSSVDLTNDFFYSYTYPIMQSLQKNVSLMGEEGMPYDNMFVWNAFLTQAIRSRCKNTIWTIALVHGNFKQVGIFSFSSKRRSLLICLKYEWYSTLCTKVIFRTCFSSILNIFITTGVLCSQVLSFS